MIGVALKGLLGRKLRALLTAFAIVTGVVMIRMEDVELEKRFGPEFMAYRRKVPAILPIVRVG